MGNTITPAAAAHGGRILAAMRQLLEEIPAEIAAPPDVHFKHYGVQPFALGYISKDDFLQVSILTSATTSGLQLAARILTPHQGLNYMTESLDGVSINTLTTQIYPLTEGFIESICVSNLGAGLEDGACFVCIALQRTSAASVAPHTILAQGFVTNELSVSWPPSPVRGVGGASGSAYSTPNSVGVSNPAAGADWTYTVPAGATYRLVSAFATLATSASVANRVPELIIDDGTHSLSGSLMASPQTAGVTDTYTWGSGLPLSAALSAANTAPLPQSLTLAAGWRVRTSTSGIQAADQWSTIRLCLLS